MALLWNKGLICNLTVYGLMASVIVQNGVLEMNLLN